MAQVRFFVCLAVASLLAVLAQLYKMDTSSSALDKFCGRYYFNDDRRYNFVAAEKFKSEEEKINMIRLFKPSVPKAREDMPALKIMMVRPGARSENDLFVHDTLYNIETVDKGNILVMNCWTGDMQLTVDGQISRKQDHHHARQTNRKSQHGHWRGIRAGEVGHDLG